MWKYNNEIYLDLVQSIFANERTRESSKLLRRNIAFAICESLVILLAYDGCEP